MKSWLRINQVSTSIAFQVAQWSRICLQCERPRFDPCIRKIPWRRAWQPIPVFLPGESHGQRSLVGYRPWGCKELDTTEWLSIECLHSRSPRSSEKTLGIDSHFSWKLSHPGTSSLQGSRGWILGWGTHMPHSETRPHPPTPKISQTRMWIILQETKWCAFCNN